MLKGIHITMGKFYQHDYIVFSVQFLMLISYMAMNVFVIFILFYIGLLEISLLM